MGIALSASAAAVRRECTAAGVVFHPRGGRLNPELTRGAPPAGLFARVQRHRVELLAFFADTFRWMDDVAGEAEKIANDSTGDAGGDVCGLACKWDGGDLCE